MVADSSEVWKPIADYEDYYEVSNLGRIRSHDRLIDRSHAGMSNYVLAGRIIRQRLDKDGYSLVTLNKDKQPRTFKVHRLVLITFEGNPNNLPQVDHKNWNRSDNRLTNLSWSTVSDNLLRRTPTRSESGYTGIRRIKKASIPTWQAHAYCFKTKRFVHIGVYHDLGEAVRGREAFMQGARNGGSR